MNTFRGTQSLNNLFNVTGVKIPKLGASKGSLAVPPLNLTMPTVYGSGSGGGGTASAPNSIDDETEHIDMPENSAPVGGGSGGSGGIVGGGSATDPNIPETPGVLEKPAKPKDYFTKKNIIIAIIVVVVMAVAYKTFKKK